MSGTYTLLERFKLQRVARFHNRRGMFAQVPLPLRQLKRDGHVGMYRRKRFGKRRIGLPFLQEFYNARLHALAEVFRVLFERLVDVVERAEFFDKLGGGLLAYPLDTGNVVGRIEIGRASCRG